MAKDGGGRLTKILKKVQSMGRHSRPATLDDDAGSHPRRASFSCSRDLHAVLVGKSRRRYLIGSDVVGHPLFRELVERSPETSPEITVACEVVLFEHLLWMLQNADPQPESLDELVDFYACS